MFRCHSSIKSALAASARLLLIAVVVLTSVPQTAKFTVAAQTPVDTIQARANERPVERWFGTIRESTLEWGPNVGQSRWVTPGVFDWAEAFKWDIKVYADGYARANVKWTIEQYSYSQSELNDCHIMIIGGTDYQVEDCRYSYVVEDAQGEFLLEGTRDVGPDGKPRITWQRQIRLDDLRVVWSAEGTKVWYRPKIWVEGPMRLPDHVKDGWEMGLGWTFTLEPGTGGRAPRAVNGLGPFHRWVTSSSISVHSGYLTGIVDDPTLNLDIELLENSTFLAQVPIDDLFTANVEWNSTDAGKVAWQLGAVPVEQVGPTTARAVPKIINVGSRPQGVTPLTVQAKNTLGGTSAPQTTQVAVAPPPGFAGGPANISGVKIGDVVQYKNEFKFPEPKFTAIKDVPGVVPFFGGNPFGIRDGQATGWAEVLSSGSGSLRGAGEGWLIMAGGEAYGSVGAKGNGILDRSGWHISDGSIQVKIGGKFRKEEPLLKAIPALLPALTAIERISQTAADFIKSRAKAVLEVFPRVEVNFNFVSGSSGLEFKSGEARPVLGFKTYIELQVIKDLLKAATGVGGDISAIFKVPAPYFKEARLRGLVFAKIVFWRLAWEGEKSWSTVISGAGAAAAEAIDALLAESASGKWRLSDRDYLNRPDYAQFVGEYAVAPEVAAPLDQLVIRNVYPQADPAYVIRMLPSLANSDPLVWTHDRPDLPAQSAGEIAWSIQDYNGWVAPRYLTNDDRDDWNPQLIVLSSGEGLALWQRMDVADPGDFNTDPAGVLSHMQIAAGRIVSNSPLVTQLSASGTLNHRPMLAATTQGALAVWVNNPANQLIGTAAAPDRVMYATFTKSTRTWSAPAQALGGVADMLSFDLAANGNNAALVYQRDMDGDMSTDADHELFYVLWQNGVWSAPVQLTNNTVPDEAPELALAADGSPSLTWQQNGALVYLGGAWGNPPQSLDLPDAVGRLDYQLVRGDRGELALAWQQAEANGTGFGYAIYDSVNRQWGEQGLYMPPAITSTITPTIGAVTGLSASFVPETNGPARSLAAAYLLAHVELITRTVEGVAIPNVPMPAQYDLRVVSLPLGTNLSIATPDLTTPDDTTIQAVVHNTGQLAAANVPAVLFTGSAGFDPARAMTQTVPVVRGGQAVTVTFNLPEALRNADKYTVVVAPSRILTETNYNDNMATLGNPLHLTMLAPAAGDDSVQIEGRVTVSSTIYSAGIVSSTLRVGDQRVGSMQIDLPITPTAVITVSAPITIGLLGPGRHLVEWQIASNDLPGDTDSAAGYAATTVLIAPDLAADPLRIGFGRLPGATAPFVMDVTNVGNWPSSAGVVEVYDGLPGRAGTRSLLRLTLPSIAPGYTAEISGMLQLTGLPAQSSGLAGIYVQLDADETLEEINENNNLVAAGNVLVGGPVALQYRVFLPIINR